MTLRGILTEDLLLCLGTFHPYSVTDHIKLSDRSDGREKVHILVHALSI